MMTAPTLADLTIPKIACPSCGSRMRLATVEPEAIDNRQRMTFTCGCGFDHRQSHAVMIEQTL